METDKPTHDNTELHSEKVRQLLGDIPPSLILWGNAAIVIVLAALIAALCLLPYSSYGGESILQPLLQQPSRLHRDIKILITNNRF